MNLKKITRASPVVWSKNNFSPLNAEQISFYKENGFIKLKNIIDQQSINEILNRVMELYNTNGENVVSELQEETIRQIFEIHNEPTLKDFYQHDYVLKAVKQILDDQVYIYQSKINYKKAFTGKSFNFHTDYITWHNVDGMPEPRAINIDICVTEQSFYNGALMVVPKSHLYYVPAENEQPKDQKFNFKDNLQTQDYDTPKTEIFKKLIETYGIEYIALKPGDILLFDPNLIHGSSNNISPYDRIKLMFSYNSVTNKPKKSVRPNYMANHNIEEVF
ncbi:phytanoyl-CoA dioxygenase family protein [Cysteiniphilum sp. 19S12-1]|uniref:phytanoyl-CoA dioxygenase family protein n=1 Tax=Cysteiniphilum sp. 19S12-1 TaxID=3453130 RepID=UPI003F8255A2